MAAGTSTWLSEALTRVRGARVGVLGDFCLDCYWIIDPDDSEKSIETGLPVRRAQQQWYGLGGAGNIAANLCALGANAVHTVGIIGNDMMGGHMITLMKEWGMRTDGMLRIQDDWQTLAYGKPYVGTNELNRIDFGSFNRINDLSMRRLAEALDRTAQWCDLIILNQQLEHGTSPPQMIEMINRVIARHARCRFIVDSRDRAEMYLGAMKKMNVDEAARACEMDMLPGHDDSDSARKYAAELFQRNGKPIFITQGERGIVVADKNGLHESPVAPIEGEIDPVGAGDTVCSAIAAVLAGGGDTVTAARLANLAARVTVKKLKTTGTASPDEIREAALEAGE